MALGLHLSGLQCRLHAMGVCDDPQYFYDYIDGLLKGMGATKDTTGPAGLTRFAQDTIGRACHLGVLANKPPDDLSSPTFWQGNNVE